MSDSGRSLGRYWNPHTRQRSFSRLRCWVIVVGAAAVWTFAVVAGAAAPAAPQADQPAPPAAVAVGAAPWEMSALMRPPSFEWLDKSGPVRRLLYEGQPYRGKKTRVFAYYASPATLGTKAAPSQKYPGVVLVHGGGGHAYREWAQLWARRGYAAIAMDLAGCGDRGRRRDDGGPDQGDDDKFGRVNDPVTDQWTYHAVANVILAHSLLRSLPEVDAERTAVTGISWGGYLTCIVAGLDTRFKAAVPVYGCGFLHENSCWTPRLQAMKPDERDRWVRLWDPSRYVGGATMPMLFVNGTNDFAYYLDSYARTYRLTHGPRNYCITVNMPHGHPQGWTPIEIGLFVDQYLKAGQPLPLVARPVVDSGKVSAEVTSATAIKSAALHFTAADGPYPKRRWTSRPLTIAGKQLRGEAPPAEARVWFVTVVDERGATVSSELMIADTPRQAHAHADADRTHGDQVTLPTRITVRSRS